jgi:hypothetical protein
MKCTQYFLYVKQRPDRAIIKEEWILDTIKKPIKTEFQTDGRIKKWHYIEEMDKYFRIILLEDGETVHNAFFDRSFKEEGK